VSTRAAGSERIERTESSFETRWDVVVIDGGTAGLAAALTIR
jgi:hypothetical protein